MSLLLFLAAGLALPTMIGWLSLALLEGRTPVLLRAERWVLGCVLGMTLTMFVTFLFHLTGLVSFTRFGFLLVQMALTIVLGYFWLNDNARHAPVAPLPSSPPMTLWMRIATVVLGCWVGLKLLAGFFLLTLSPPFYDDVFNNWNMRAKVFFLDGYLRLDLPIGNELISAQGVSSYPPTVPMAKAWLAALAGQWSEPLVNSIHFVWYVCALALVFFALRRLLPRAWALLGTYFLASIPLYLIHGTTAYADVFLSIHVFAAVTLIFFGLEVEDAKQRRSFLRLGALATALLVFTKNEALMMYLPAILAVLVLSLWLLRRNGRIKPSESRENLLRYAGYIAVVAVPWILFKWMHQLPFGNAKGISGFALGWQPGVAKALWINTFFEGNWSLLFPVFLGLLAASWRRAFGSPLFIPIAFTVIVIGGQAFLYLFTSLSVEALGQTGTARGLIHVIPLVVFVVTVLLADIVETKR